MVDMCHLPARVYDYGSWQSQYPILAGQVRAFCYINLLNINRVAKLGDQARHDRGLLRLADGTVVGGEVKQGGLAQGYIRGLHSPHQPGSEDLPAQPSHTKTADNDKGDGQSLEHLLLSFGLGNQSNPVQLVVNEAAGTEAEKEIHSRQDNNDPGQSPTQYGTTPTKEGNTAGQQE